MRQLRPDDDLSFIADEPGLSPEAAQLRADQRWLLSSGFPESTCWIGLDERGDVCFMTWLLTAQDNERMRNLWGDWLPELAPDEALIEGIYTAESHRGLGIMAVAATRIGDRAYEQLNVRWGLGFIGTGNSSSLRGGEKAGWIPYIKRKESWLLFRRRVRFLPIADATS